MIKVSLSFEDDFTLDVDAYDTGIPNICIHRNITRDRFSEKVDGWSLTHTPTGFLITSSLKTKKNASILANQLGSICDWGDIRSVKLFESEILKTIAEFVYSQFEAKIPRYEWVQEWVKISPRIEESRLVCRRIKET